MKTHARLKSTDVTSSVILLGVLTILGCIVMYSPPTGSVLDKKPLSINDLDPGFRTATIKTHCYSIPYTREQLKNIEKDGGEAREELNRILLEKTEAEDLSLIVAPPKIVFDDKSSMVCLDFKDPAVESDPFETRIV